VDSAQRAVQVHKRLKGIKMTPNDPHGNWTLLLFGLFIGIWAGWQLKKGIISVKSHAYTKTERPILFWFGILSLLSASLFCIVLAILHWNYHRPN
jgi:hypothetical protein